MKRNPKLPFMGGFHAFVGGAVDDGDARLPIANAPAGEPIGVVGSALRECFEESGVLFGRLAKPLSEGERHEWRRKLCAKTPERRFEELVGEHGLVFDASPLTPAGHWITPPFSPRRFDTRFYFAEIPAGEDASVIPGELVEGEWIRAQDAIDRWGAGEVLLSPPTLHLLRAAASHPDPAHWADAALGIPQAKGEEPRRIEMRRGIVLVPLRTPTLPPATHTNCYVVGGAAPVVVDPGANDPAEQAVLDDVLASLAREGRRTSRIAITHQHPDHVGGVDALRARLGVPVVAHALTRDALAGVIKVDATIGDGDALPTGDGSAPLRALHTPGHARGHLAFVEEGTASLLSGDLILGGSTTVIDPPDGDLGEFLASLERLAGMRLRSLFPGHGPVLADALAKIHEYQRHRKEREEQILAALRAGAREVPAIVARVYIDVDPAMHAFAARNVVATLELLEKKGAVKRSGSGWET